jgi:hypothetical protein
MEHSDRQAPLDRKPAFLSQGYRGWIHGGVAALYPPSSIPPLAATRLRTLTATPTSHFPRHGDRETQLQSREGQQSIRAPRPRGSTPRRGESAAIRGPEGRQRIAGCPANAGSRNRPRTRQAPAGPAHRPPSADSPRCLGHALRHDDFIAILRGRSRTLWQRQLHVHYPSPRNRK